MHSKATAYPQREAPLPLSVPFTWFLQTLPRQPWLLSEAIKASPQSSEESSWPQVSLCSTQQTGESDSLWVTLLFITLINGPRDQGTFLPATEVLIRMGTFKLSVSATPFTLLTSFCLPFPLLALSLFPSYVCLGVCLKQDGFSWCFKGWLHQRTSWPHSFISNTDLLLVTA